MNILSFHETFKFCRGNEIVKATVTAMQEGIISNDACVSLISICGRAQGVELDQPSVAAFVLQKLSEVIKAKYETTVSIKIWHSNDIENLPSDDIMSDVVKHDIQKANWFDSVTESGTGIGPAKIGIDISHKEL
jgi:hypothetical protein